MNYKITLGAFFLLILGSNASYAKDKLLEQVATIINLNGHLCAEVLDVRPLESANTYEVTCIEYRGGTGQVRYILDALKGVAFKSG